MLRSAVCQSFVKGIYDNAIVVVVIIINHINFDEP